MPSFDIVVKVDLQEVDNAVNQAQKELQQRYDFKGSKSQISWDKKGEVILVGDDDYKLRALKDILESKLVRRGVSIKNLTLGNPEPSFEGTLRQTMTFQQGISTEKAKDLVKMIKDTKLKVQSQIQEAQVRVIGKKKDELQEIMGLVRKVDLGLDFQFINFRD